MAPRTLRLLVITNDIDIKGLMEDLTRQQQVQAVITASVVRAAQFLQRNSLPDIVILDLSMADEPALAFLQQMRARGEFSKLPVLVLTAVPDPDLVRTALQAGANRYLTKLFVSKNLLSTLDQMLIGTNTTRRLTARMGGGT
jgi:DNA-binding response OmpR family regulator